MEDPQDCLQHLPHRNRLTSGSRSTQPWCVVTLMFLILILDPGARLFNTNAPAWRQQHLLGQNELIPS